MKYITSFIYRGTGTFVVCSINRYVRVTMTSGDHCMRQIAIIGFVCCVRLTAVFLITPVRTVAEAVTSEASDDAVDTISAGEECRGAL